MPKNYTTSLKGEKIELPKEMITFYSKREDRFESIFLTSRFLPSYEDVKGRGANDPPECVYDKKGDPIVITSSLKNENNSLDEAIRKSRLVGKYLFRENDLRAINVVDRSYMLNGETKPIRTSFLIGGKKKVAYVKKPELLRVLGKDLYNHLSGNRLNFRFNEEVFAVEQVNGWVLSHENKFFYLRNEKVIEGIIRLSVLDGFMAISDLASDGGQRNVLIDSKYNMIPIDFDCLFLGSPSKLSVIDYYKHYFGFKFPGGLLEDVLRDEKIKIKRRFLYHKKYLEKLIRMMSSIPKLNDRVKEHLGDKTVGHYFDRRLNEIQFV